MVDMPPSTAFDCDQGSACTTDVLERAHQFAQRLIDTPLVASQVCSNGSDAGQACTFYMSVSLLRQDSQMVDRIDLMHSRLTRPSGSHA